MFTWERDGRSFHIWTVLLEFVMRRQTKTVNIKIKDLKKKKKDKGLCFWRHGCLIRARGCCWLNHLCAVTSHRQVSCHLQPLLSYKFLLLRADIAGTAPAFMVLQIVAFQTPQCLGELGHLGPWPSWIRSHSDNGQPCHVSAPKAILNRVTGQVSESVSFFWTICSSKLWRTWTNTQGKHLSPFGQAEDMKANLRAENKKDMLELNLGRPYMPD